MHQGNWKCSGCGGKITELPFQPRSESGLTCRDCWSKDKNGESVPAPEAAPAAEEMPSDFPMDMDENMPAGEMPADDGFGDAKPVTPGEKPKAEGKWSCAGCGGAINSLPFTPRDTSNLKCLDCFKASKQ